LQNNLHLQELFKTKILNMARYTIQIFALMIVYIHHISSLPNNSHSNTQEKTQAEIRASLITKDNFKAYFAEKRQEKSSFNQKLPKPFVIKTNLKFGSNSGSRRGRSFQDSHGSTIVEGVRVPDDNTDTITHRNGRFINNIFVPNGAVLPRETIVSSHPKIQRARQPRAYNNQWSAVPQRAPEPRSGYPYPAFNYDDHYRGRTPDLPDSIAIESRQQPAILRPDGQPVAQRLSAPPNPSYSAPSNTEETGRDYFQHGGNSLGQFLQYWKEQNKMDWVELIVAVLLAVHLALELPVAVYFRLQSNRVDLESSLYSDHHS
jgi:hypothetical protein